MNRNGIPIFVLIAIVGLTLWSCQKLSPEEIDEIILKSETLRKLDSVCMEFPKPQSFELEERGFGGNSLTSSIHYQYISHAPFESVKQFYQNSELRVAYQFQNENYLDNWINEINFRQGNVNINIHNRPPSGIVTIGCSTSSNLATDR